jgi:Thioredoxin like C-terminal domain
MPPRTDIVAPEFPAQVEWINAPFVRLGTLLGRNVPLVWFWDCASLNALRALPYLNEWHDRYAGAGLRVIGVHSPQFDFGRRRELVERAVESLSIRFAVVLDSDYAVWRLYGNEVWPAIYLWDRRCVLRHHHFGEGAYEETEQQIQESLLEIDPALDLPDLMAPLRATDAPDALVRAPTPHRYLEEDRSARAVEAGDELSVRYQGASAAAVLEGEGEVDVLVDGDRLRTVRLDGAGLYELVVTGAHEEHDVTLRFRAPARAYGFSFGAGPA